MRVRSTLPWHHPAPAARRRRAAGVAVALLAGLLAPLPAGSAQAATAPAQNLSRNSSESALSDIALSGDRAYVAWQDRGYDAYGHSEIVLARSTDGGRTFPHRRNVSFSIGIDSAHPAVAASDEHVYVVWHDFTTRESPSGGNREITFRASSDHGATFGTSTNLSDDVDDSVDPRVAASGRHVQVAWRDLSGQLWLSSSHDHGRTFAKQLVATGVVGFGGPSVARDTVHLSWTERGGESTAVRLGTSGGHGAEGLVRTTLATGASSSSTLDVATWDDDIHVLWTERHERTTTGPDGEQAVDAPSTRLVLVSSRAGAPFGAPVTVREADGIQSADLTVTDGLGLVAWSQTGAAGGSFFRRFSPTGVLDPVQRVGDPAATGATVRWSTGGGSLPSAEPSPRLLWRTPERFPRQDADGDGLIDYRQDDASYRQPAGFPLVLDACRSDGGDAEVTRYRWTIAGEVTESEDCTLEHTFASEGEHAVRLEVEASDGDRTAVDLQVPVEDLLVVSLGDSVASGEGNPDVPGRSDWPWDPDAVWQDERCNRTALSGPAEAALQLEERDPATSVTFVQLACSGATINEDDVEHGGLLTPYAGVHPETPPLAPQVDALRDLLTTPDGGLREIDALLLSIGANDLKFGDVVAECVAFDCVDEGSRQEVTTRLALLPAKYAELADALEGLVAPERVFITEYFDPTRNSSGIPDLSCVADSLPGQSTTPINVDETYYAAEEVLPGLNGAVHAAAAEHGWTLVSGIASGFASHGYCAEENWIVQLGESFAQQDNEFGAFHPNVAGHQAYGRLIAQQVAAHHRTTPPAGGTGDTDAPRLIGADTALGVAGSEVTVTGVDSHDPQLQPLSTVQVSRHPEDGYSGAVRLAATADGIVATWTQHEGAADGGSLAGSGPMEVYVSHLESTEADLELLAVRPVQGPDDPERLVAGKPLAVEMDVHNGLGSGKHVLVRLQVTAAGPTGAPVERDELMTVGIPPGTSTVHLVPDLALEPAADSAELQVTATLDPTGLLEESDETNNTAASSPLPVAESRLYKVLYVPLVVGDGEPVGCRAVEELARDGGRWVTAAFPVADEESRHTASCESALRVPAGALDDAQLTDALLQADQLARSTGFDAAVGVAPAGWFASTPVPAAAGIAIQGDPGSSSPPASGAIVESGAAGRVVGHELAHLFGAAHQDRLPAEGYNVLERRPEGGLDVMAPVDGPDRWISRETFAFLLDRLQLTPEDPPILVLRGTVAPDGTVSTGTWYQQMGLLDVELGATGELTLDYLDAAGAVLGSTGFDVHGLADAHDDATQGFAVRVPDVPGTTTLVLRRGADVVHERTVSANAPAVSLTAPAGAAQLEVGSETVVSWTSTDADGDPLRSAIWLSTDDGTTWLPLATDVTGGEYAFTPSRRLIGDQLRVKVMTSDGVSTTEQVSEAFSVVATSAAAGGGRIAYAHKGRIWMMREDGRLQTDVSGAAGGTDADPSLSSDGRKLVFESRRNDPAGPTQVWVADADGGGAVALGVGYDPAWSRDGSRIAFMRDALAGGVMQPHVAVMAADGSGATVLTPGHFPSWSPAGDAIAYYESSSSSLTVINPDGSGKQRLHTDLNEAFTSLAWSPDGTEIAYVGSRSEAVRAVPSSGGAPRALTPDGAAAYGYNRGLSWSPDGASIVYYGGAIDGLVVRTLATDEERSLTPGRWSGSDAADPSWANGTAAVPGDDGGTGMLVFPRNDNLYTVRSDGTGEQWLPEGRRGRDPVWSPDGTQIASWVDGSIRVLDADGWLVQTLPAGTAPDWSPTGTHLVYQSSRDGRTDLWMTDLETGAESRLTDSGSATTPSWSPDGRTIAFVGGPGSPENTRSDLWLLDMSTRSVRAVPDASDVSEYAPAWSPDGTLLAFQTDRHTWTVAPDGSGRRQMASGQQPAWSPDGKRLAFYSETLHPFSGGYEVVLLSTDGTRVTHLPGVLGAVDWKALPADPGTPEEPEEPAPARPADAGGPYTAQEGADLRLDASASAVVPGEVPLYAWDLDADGEYDDASGPAPIMVLDDDDGERTVGLRVTRSDGTSSTDTAEVTVSNVAPVVVTSEADAAVGMPVTLGAVFQDVEADEHTATIIWGDGASSPATVTAGGVSTTHTYATAGSVEATVEVCDDDGACGSAVLPVTVHDELPPTVDALDTVTSPGAGGATIQVLGSGFVAGSHVHFGAVPATELEVVSDRLLEVVVPAAPAGDVHVVVTTPAGTSATSAASAFTYENARPTVQDRAAEVVRGGTVDIDLVAADSDGDALRFAIVSSAEDERLTWVDADTVRYAAPADEGTHELLVVASDGTQSSDAATITVEVLDQAPVAHPDAADASSGTTLTIPLSELLANDTDPEGDPLSVVGAFMPVGSVGTVELIGDAVAYQPPTGRQLATTTFSYLASDGHGRTDVGTVTVQLPAPADGPAPTDPSPSSPSPSSPTPTPSASPTVPAGPGGSRFVPLPPTRLLDTRTADGDPVGPGKSLSLQVTGTAGVPNSGVTAVVLNVTAVDPTAHGFVTAHPTGQTRPSVSNLNTTPGLITPNLVVVEVGTDGRIDLFNKSGHTHLLADLAGYYTS